MTAPQILTAIAAIAAAAYGLTYLRREKTALRGVFKTAPIALLPVAAFLAGGSPLLVAALVFCAAGDWFLAFDGERNFLLGLGSFLIGHVLYTLRFVAGIGPEAFLTPDMLPVLGFLAAIVVLVSIRLWPHTGVMRIPVVLYSLAIVAMVASAKASGQNTVALAGVVLFMVSDIILARETFLPSTGSFLDRNSDYFVWFLYAASQILIVSGLLFVA